MITVRLLDTLWIIAAIIIFGFAFFAAAAWALRLNPNISFETRQEAILIYAPWAARDQMLFELDENGIDLVSSNASDTAWLVSIPSAKALESVLAGVAVVAFKPTDIAIVVAGCGAVVIDATVTDLHAPS